VLWNGEAMMPEPISIGTRLMNYRYHLGELLTFAEADTIGTAVRATATTWGQLEVGVAGAKIAFHDAAWWIEAVDAGDEPMDAMGITTNLLPIGPVTLPVSVNFFFASVRAPSVSVSTVDFGASYMNPADPLELIDVFSSSSVSGDRVRRPASGLVIADTLGTHGTLSVADADDVLPAAPTVAWSSDGFRLVGHGNAARRTACRRNRSGGQTEDRPLSNPSRALQPRCPAAQCDPGNHAVPV
jgi:hypothetical protein